MGHEDRDCRSIDASVHCEDMTSPDLAFFGASSPRSASDFMVLTSLTVLSLQAPDHERFREQIARTGL
jgi:hypothetical protein